MDTEASVTLFVSGLDMFFVLESFKCVSWFLMGKFFSCFFFSYFGRAETSDLIKYVTLEEEGREEGDIHLFI